MAKDDRDLLEVLRDELDFIEKGGYGQSVRTPWKDKSVFQDSLTCINYADPTRARPCSECHLLDFVAAEHRNEQVPCHFIPLNEEGDTIATLEGAEATERERELKSWLRARIRQLEEERAGGPPVTAGEG